MMKSTVYNSNRLSRIWQKITLMGIHDKLAFDKIKKIKVLNNLSLWIANILILTNLRWLIMGIPEFIFLNLTGIAIMTLVVISNSRNNYVTAKALFFIYIPVHITLLCLIMSFGFELFFFPIIIIAGFVFERRRFLILYIILLTLCFVLIKSEALSFDLFYSTPTYRTIFISLSALLSVLLCYLSINLFIQQYEENRSEILIKNEMLEESASISREKAEFTTLLLREMNHRVKNNLQLISSLLNIHAQKIEDSNAKSALQEAKSRVHSIALIHKQLYKDQDINSVNICEYIEDLINNISGTTPGHANEIDFNYKCNNFTIDVDDAVSIGLIINELIINAIQHGLSESKPKKVELNVNKTEANKLIVKIEDSGSGIQSGFTPDNGGFGYELIETLTLSYDGAIVVDEKVNKVTVTLDLSKNGF